MKNVKARFILSAESKKHTLSSCILLCCLVLSSCVSTMEYPNDWAPVKATDAECPDLSGDYNDDDYKLGPLFFGPYEHKFYPVQVIIEGPADGNLHIKAINGNTVHGEKTYVQNKNFVCKEGQLEFIPSSDDAGKSEGAVIGTDLPGGLGVFLGVVGGGAYGGGIGKGSSYWVKAEDGSLITRNKDGMAGFAGYGCFCIPMIMYEDKWERFKTTYKPEDSGEKQLMELEKKM